MCFFWLDVDIMAKEVPQAGSIVVSFCAKSLQRGKGKGSLEMVAAGNSSGVGPSAAEGSMRKRRKKVSNIATTTQSSGGTPTRPPPPSRIRLESSSPVGEFEPDAVVASLAPQAPMALLSLMGGDLKFSRGIWVSLLLVSHNLLVVVPKEDLLLGGIEMLCRGLLMTQLGVDARGRRVEEISWLDMIWLRLPSR